jgi:hypothetical protein
MKHSKDDISEAYNEASEHLEMCADEMPAEDECEKKAFRHVAKLLREKSIRIAQGGPLLPHPALGRRLLIPSRRSPPGHGIQPGVIVIKMLLLRGLGGGETSH